MAAERVYLDHNASTPPYPEVVEELARVLRAFPGNPSSLHSEGRAARSLLDQARERIAAILRTSATRILFCSGATEANNLALRGVAAHALSARGQVLLAVSAVEHPSVLDTARTLQSCGARLEILPVDAAGCLRLESLEASLAHRPDIVSVMAANNETGAIQPLGQIQARCKAEGIILHVDAAQAIGRIPFDLERYPADFVTFSGHKMHGPRGIGVLVRPGLPRFVPQLTGGPQELGLRAGTENPSAASALALAFERAAASLEDRQLRILARREFLLQGLRDLFPRLVVNTDMTRSLPNTLNLSFPGLSGETLVLALDLEGVSVSMGSACSSGAIEPPAPLLAMGLSRSQALSSLRVSLDDSTSDDEIERAVRAFSLVLRRLDRRTRPTPRSLPAP